MGKSRLKRLAVLLVFSCDQAPTTTEGEHDPASTATPATASSTTTTTSETTSKAGTFDIEIKGCDTDCGKSVQTNLQTSTAAVDTVIGELAPGSLAIADQNLTSGEPDISGCFSEHGPAACSKVAIQFYLWLASKPIEAAQEILEGATSLFASLKANPGQFTVEDGTIINYSITSTEAFDIRIENSSDNLVFFSQEAAGKYQIRFYSPNSDVTSGTVIQYFRADIDFTDKDNFSAQLYTTDEKCTGQGTPPIGIKVDKQGGLWRGKSMVYLLKDNDNCVSDSSGDSGYYTEFVGDADHTTGSTYWFPSSASPQSLSTNELADYSIDGICSNLPGNEMVASQCPRINLPALTDASTQSWNSCTQGTAEYDASLVQVCTTCQTAGYSDFTSCNQIPSFRWFYIQKSHPNPYCIAKTTSVLTPVNRSKPENSSEFGSACNGTSSSAIDEADYSPQSDWITPAELRDLSYEDFYCMPVSLEDKKNCL